MSQKFFSVCGQIFDIVDHREEIDNLVGSRKKMTRDLYFLNTRYFWDIQSESSEYRSLKLGMELGARHKTVYRLKLSDRVIPDFVYEERI